MAARYFRRHPDVVYVPPPHWHRGLGRLSTVGKPFCLHRQFGRVSRADRSQYYIEYPTKDGQPIPGSRFEVRVKNVEFSGRVVPWWAKDKKFEDANTMILWCRYCKALTDVEGSCKACGGCKKCVMAARYFVGKSMVSIRSWFRPRSDGYTF